MTRCSRWRSLRSAGHRPQPRQSGHGWRTADGRFVGVPTKPIAGFASGYRSCW